MNDNFEYDTVLSEVDDGGVRTITLNRPERLNAMNRQLIDDVALAFGDAQQDPSTKAIIFTGAGRAFCAGDDRREHVQPADEAEARDLVVAIQRATEAIVFGPKPVVGSDQRMGRRRRLRVGDQLRLPDLGGQRQGFFPEVSLNIFVTGAVTSLLPAMVGLLKAREMLFLGERYDATTLHTLGVAWRVVPDEELMTVARDLATRLAGLPSLAAGAMRRVLNLTASTNLVEALRLETDATVAGFLDPETTRLLNDFG